MDTDSKENDLKMPKGSYEYKNIWWRDEEFQKENLKRLPEFKFLPDDVLIATWPKCGTTWMIEVVYLMLHKEDLENARKTLVFEKAAFLEIAMPGLNVPCGMDMASTMESPRLLKTHMMPHFLSPTLSEVTPKVILVTRNPKDALVSYFNHYKLMFKADISWNEFFELFQHGRLVHGNWCDFTNEWWPHTQKENVLLITYEDMLSNLKKNIEKIGKFLDISLDDEVLKRITSLCTFKSMKESPSVKQLFGNTDFFRKGVSGDYANYFTVAQNEYFDNYFTGRMKDSECKLYI